MNQYVEIKEINAFLNMITLLKPQVTSTELGCILRSSVMINGKRLLTYFQSPHTKKASIEFSDNGQVLLEDAFKSSGLDKLLIDYSFKGSVEHVIEYAVQLIYNLTSGSSFSPVIGETSIKYSLLHIDSLIKNCKNTII